MTPAIGVGFVGRGPVTQAIHVPTLAALDTRSETFAGDMEFVRDAIRGDT